MVKTASGYLLHEKFRTSVVFRYNWYAIVACLEGENHKLTDDKLPANLIKVDQVEL